MKDNLEKLDKVTRGAVIAAWRHVLLEMKNIADAKPAQRNTQARSGTRNTWQQMSAWQNSKKSLYDSAVDFVVKELMPTNGDEGAILIPEMCSLLKDYADMKDVQGCHEDLGMYGFDSPGALLDETIQHAKQRHSDLAAIIVNGDFIGHGFAVRDSSASDKEQLETWQRQRAIIQTDMQKIRDAFPGKALLPSIGNNDVIVHNEVPCNEHMAATYYQQLFDTWFPMDHLPPNFDYNTAHETFSKGGYYRYDFSDSNLAVLALNTMFFSENNQCMHGRGKDQMMWLTDQLDQNSKLLTPKKIILTMHIFPGLNHYGGKI